MPLISVCSACAEKLKEKYILNATDAAPRVGECQLRYPPHMATLWQYEMTPRYKPRARRPAPSGPPKKKRRAQYKEPWRDSLKEKAGDHA